MMDSPIWARAYVGEDLLSWHVAHELTTRLEGDALVVADTDRNSFHLLRIFSPEFLYRKLKLKILLKPSPNASKNCYVHHYGNIDVAEVTLDCIIVNHGTSTLLSANRRSDGLIEIDLEFLNCHPSLSIGTSSSGHPVYAGDGRDQFAIVRIAVEVHDASAMMSGVAKDERITIVDVGAQGGLQLKWMLKADRITPVMLEPIVSEAEKLRVTTMRIPGGVVIPKALAHVNGGQTLYVARESACSSLRKPNFNVLDNYPVRWIFETVEQRSVECVRYDELFRQNLAPRPDVIKIDVQGFEYEVLLGFGHLLETCLGIEIETHFYPIYEGEKVTGDIVNFLSDFGFVLRELNVVRNFDGDAVEFDAQFTKRKCYVMKFSDQMKRKFSLLTEVWGLSPYL